MHSVGTLGKSVFNKKRDIFKAIFKKKLQNTNKYLSKALAVYCGTFKVSKTGNKNWSYGNWSFVQNCIEISLRIIFPNTDKNF